LFCAEIGIAYAHDDEGVACVPCDVVVPEVAEQVFGLVFDARRIGGADLREGGDVGVLAAGISDVGWDIDIDNAVS
jgi:hypothetical protein